MKRNPKQKQSLSPNQNSNQSQIKKNQPNGDSGKTANVELKVVVNSYSNNSLKLDPINPVPIDENGDFFGWNNNYKYIPFIGSDDNFDRVLLAARLNSPTQHACISSIAQSVIGKGIKISNIEDININSEFTTWLKSVNRYRHSFNEILIHCTDGERNFGNQFIEVVKGDIKGKRFMKIYLQPMTKCRLAAPEDDQDDNETQYVIISERFKKSGFVYDEEKDKKIPLWSPNLFDQKNVWQLDEKGYLHTMLHFKNEVSSIEHYGLPASIAGIRHQLLEAKAAQFNIDNFDNNMILGGILIFKSGMTQSEAQRTAREIFLTHIGEGKTGRIAVVASEEGLNEVDFKPFSTARDGSYNDADKRWEEKIIEANGWDSILAGINRSSTFGNGSQYIRSIWDAKDAVLLNPLRNKLITKVVNPLVQMWSDHYNVKEVLNYQFELQTNMPFSFMGDLDPNTFFEVNEARTKAGLPFDKNKEGVYLSEMRPKNMSNNNIQTNPDSNTSTSDGTGTGNK